MEIYKIMLIPIGSYRICYVYDKIGIDWIYLIGSYRKNQVFSYMEIVYSMLCCKFQ
jgi:hypothetical protein